MQDLVIRIVFILGNLTAKHNQAREHFSKEKGSIQTLLSLFQTFYCLDLHSQRRGCARAKQPTAQRPPSEAEDVLIKLTRVLANVAIHPRVGPALAANRQVVSLLLTTLGKIRGPRWVGGWGVVNVWTTLTNLSCVKENLLLFTTALKHNPD